MRVDLFLAVASDQIDGNSGRLRGRVLPVKPLLRGLQVVERLFSGFGAMGQLVHRFAAGLHLALKVMGALHRLVVFGLPIDLFLGFVRFGIRRLFAASLGGWRVHRSDVPGIPWLPRSEHGFISNQPVQSLEKAPAGAEIRCVKERSADAAIRLPEEFGVLAAHDRRETVEVVGIARLVGVGSTFAVPLRDGHCVRRYVAGRFQ